MQKGRLRKARLKAVQLQTDNWDKQIKLFLNKKSDYIRHERGLDYSVEFTTEVKSFTARLTDWIILLQTTGELVVLDDATFTMIVDLKMKIIKDTEGS